jgi:hypothetical protein
MKYPCTDGMSVMLKSCPAFFPIPKPLTNADRIRTMTDEELAETFRDFKCNACDWNGFCEEEEQCKAQAHKWLKQECDS